MKIISLENKKSQSIAITLAGQHCILRLIQRPSALYLDLAVDGHLLIQGVPCLYANRLVRYAYLHFKGDLLFLDNEGQEDPAYGGLAERFPFYYLTEAERVFA